MSLHTIFSSYKRSQYKLLDVRFKSKGYEVWIRYWQAYAKQSIQYNFTDIQFISQVSAITC